MRDDLDQAVNLLRDEGYAVRRDPVDGMTVTPPTTLQTVPKKTPMEEGPGIHATAADCAKVGCSSCPVRPAASGSEQKVTVVMKGKSVAVGPLPGESDAAFHEDCARFLALPAVGSGFQSPATIGVRLRMLHRVNHAPAKSTQAAAATTRTTAAAAGSGEEHAGGGGGGDDTDYCFCSEMGDAGYCRCSAEPGWATMGGQAARE